MDVSPAHRQASMPMDDQPRASRTGFSNPLGKLTAEVKGFKVSEATHEGLERLAHEAGMSVNEFVRMLVTIRVHGVGEIAKLQEDRLKIVSGLARE